MSTSIVRPTRHRRTMFTAAAHDCRLLTRPYVRPDWRERLHPYAVQLAASRPAAVQALLVAVLLGGMVAAAVICAVTR